jgi:hypothetical protein
MEFSLQCVGFLKVIHCTGETLTLLENLSLHQAILLLCKQFTETAETIFFEGQFI